MPEALLFGIEVVVGLPVSMLLVYVVSRMVTLAYFHSRRDYQRHMLNKHVEEHTNQLEKV